MTALGQVDGLFTLTTDQVHGDIIVRLSPAVDGHGFDGLTVVGWFFRLHSLMKLVYGHVANTVCVRMGQIPPTEDVLFCSQSRSR